MQIKILLSTIFFLTVAAHAADDEAKKRAEGARVALVMTFEKCADLKCLDPIIDSSTKTTSTQENKALAKSVLDEVCKKKADLCAKIPAYLAAKEKDSKTEQQKLQAALEEQKAKLKPSTPAEKGLKPASDTDAKQAALESAKKPPMALPEGDAKKSPAPPSAPVTAPPAKDQKKNP